MTTSNQHPAHQWLQAAIAGHMRGDQVTARRAALIDLLGDGRCHTRETIWEAITNQLGRECWGKRPVETLLRDLKALRRGGIHIAYSRRPGAAGYYLQYPTIKPEPAPHVEAINWQQIEGIRQMALPRKNQQAFSAAQFALRQKRLLLREQHPGWSAERVEAEARRLVFGVAL